MQGSNVMTKQEAENLLSLGTFWKEMFSIRNGATDYAVRGARISVSNYDLGLLMPIIYYRLRRDENSI